MNYRQIQYLIITLSLFILAFTAKADFLTLDELELKNGWRVKLDSSDSFYATPEWTPSQASPYILEKGTNLIVQARFDLEPDSLYDQYEVRGEATVDGQSLTFPKETLSIAGEGNGDAHIFTSDESLPNFVQTIDSLSTSWEYRKMGTSSWKDAGSSTGNTIYLVLAEPITSDLHRSVLHHACATEGATDKTTAFLNCWSQFSGPANTDTWDGQTLYYYKPGTPVPIAATTKGLLTDGNGQCLAWVDFFTDVIGCHGIAAFGVRVESIGQDTNEGSFPDDEGIVVKDWNNDNEGTSGDPDYVWQVRLNAGFITMIPDWNSDDYWDLSNIEGYLKGQNSALDSPSEKMFHRHFVLFNNLFASDAYFDPAYGKRYNDEDNIEGSALRGFFSNKEEVSSNWTYVDVRITWGGGLDFEYFAIE